MEIYPVSTNALFQVIDGDTFSIVEGDQVVRCRLNGIDAPELSQPFGEEARSWLEGKLIAPIIKKRIVDGFDRLIVEVINQEGIHLNLEMVRLGLAWVHPYYGKKYSDPDALLIARDYAIRNQLGVHSDSSVIPPWEHRRSDGKYSAIINTIRAIAEKKGIYNYRELASQCNLSFSTAYRYWVNPYSFPSYSSLLNLCNGLNVSAGDLIKLIS